MTYLLHWIFTLLFAAYPSSNTRRILIDFYIVVLVFFLTCKGCKYFLYFFLLIHKINWEFLNFEMSSTIDCTLFE